MKRGDVVLVALPGDYGKPRPAVIVQSDILNAAGLSSYLVCPLTTMLTDIADYRVSVEPSAANGLRARSEIMIDKLTAAPARRLRDAIGRCDAAVMRAVDRALLLALGIA